MTLAAVEASMKFHGLPSDEERSLRGLTVAVAFPLSVAVPFMVVLVPAWNLRVVESVKVEASFVRLWKDVEPDICWVTPFPPLRITVDVPLLNVPELEKFPATLMV